MVRGGRYHKNIPDNYVEGLEQEKELFIDGTKLFVSKNKLKWLGNALIGSSCPEEQMIIHSISHFKPEKWDFNTHLLGYGGAYVYVVAAAIKLSSLFGFVTLTPDRVFNMLNPENVQKMFVVGRLITVIAFALSVLLIYLVSYSLYHSRFVSLLSAVLLSTNAAFLIRTSYLTPWGYCIFWVLLGLYFASKIENAKMGKKYYLLSGISAGFAMGSVLPAGYVFLVIILYHFYKYKMRRIKLLFYSFLAMIVTFFIVNPYYLISFPEYMNSFEFHNESWFTKVSYLSLANHSRNLYELTLSFGVLLLVLMLMGLLLAIFKRKKQDVILACCIVIYYFVNFKIISLKYAVVSHVMPLVPVMIIIGIRVIDWIRGYKGKIGKSIAICLIVFIVLNFFTKSVFCVYKLKAAPLTEAGEWINQNIPLGSSIGATVNKIGGNVGYPPYNHLSYHFVNDADIDFSKIKSHTPDYFLAVSVSSFRDPFLKKIELLKDYICIKSFNSDVPILSRFYKNELLTSSIEEIKVFKRKHNEVK